jgi:hypothetical protein
MSASPLYTFLVEASTWSSFANSLVAAWETYGSLTPKQEAAAMSMMAKCKAKEEWKAAPKAAVDMTPIHRMFDSAKAAGLKKLAYRAEGLIITPAQESGKNPGALYVRTAGRKDYQGKLMNGVWSPIAATEAGVLEALLKIAADPSQAAKDYGRRTGQCSCCGRELTDPVSIANGIGPICAEKWSL